MINPIRSRGFVVIASTIIVGLVAYTQFRGTSGTAGSASKNGEIGVEISQMFITVENRAGRPLFDIRVAIVPVGRATLFTAMIGRLDSGERRDLSLGSFNGRDGTPFNRRVHRPNAVQVTAKDLEGKSVEVETDWN